MTQQEINILNFEYELGLTRQRLNNLIYELSLPNDENMKKMMQSKIDLMTNELHHMETQLQLLKSGLEANMTNEHIPLVMPEKQPLPQTESPKQPVSQHIDQPMPQPVNQHTDQPMPQPVLQPAPQPLPQTGERTFSEQNESANLEDIFGRNLMGIFASVLIFIGMILFGMVIIPKLSDETKIFCMYLVSFSVIAVGMACMRKSPANKFFISLTGLGTGGLFISLIMSNVYFHLFGDLMTYILLLFWAAGTILLSKFEKNLSGMEPQINVFEIIGQLGVMISVILGCILCAREADLVKFLMLVIYHLIAMTAFHCGNVSLSRKAHGASVFATEYRLQNYIFKIMTILILVFSYIVSMVTPKDSYAAMTIEEFFITLFLVLTIAENLFAAYKEEKISDLACMCYHIFMGAYALLGIMLILQFRLLNLPEVLLSYALCVILILLVELQENKYRLGAQIPLFLIALLSLLSTKAAAGAIYLLLGTVLLLLVGIWRKNSAYLITGIVSIYPWALCYFVLYKITLEIVIAVTLCAGTYLYVRNKTEDKTVRLAGYPIILLVVATVFSTFSTDMKDLLAEHYWLDEWLSELKHFKTIISFSIAGIFHICMARRNSFEDETEKVIARIINVILMLIGCKAISYHELYLLPIGIAIGIFTLNSKEILEAEERRNSSNSRKYLVMAYILLKYTILLMVILYSFQTPAFIVSISLLIFAVLSIIAGFLKRKKGYRLYGLTLSMISIFKLTMLDITTKDAVTGSISFITCGLLCFAISFIYNKIQKEYFG